MKINNVEIEDIDMLDADVAEKYENEIFKVNDLNKKITAEVKEGKIKQSEYIRKLCTAINKFLDSLWGEGTAYKVFNGKCNYITSVKAFVDVNCWANNKDTYENQFSEINEVIKKYSLDGIQNNDKNLERL